MTATTAAKPALDLDAIYQDHYKLVRKVIHAIVRDQESEDLIQTAWAEIIKSLPNFDPDPQRGSLSGWIGGIARNIANNAMRQRRNAPTMLEYVDEPEIDGPRDQINRSQLLQVCSRQPEPDTFDLKQAALAKLPEKDRVLLTQYATMSAKQLALMYGTTPAYIYKRARLARLRLKKIYAGMV